jgi:hypothetical protein
MQESAGGQQILESEARAFGRYLVGRLPAPEHIARYREAVGALLAEPISPRDTALLAFVRRHPWSLSFLDAAAGLLHRDAVLRSKLLVLAAILETSPAFADEFLPRSASLARLLSGLAVSGAAALGRLVVGLLLWPLAVRSQS